MQNLSSGNLQSQAGKQIEALKSIPWTVLNYWPGWFTFAASNYVEALVLRAIPNTGGVSGTILNAAVSGLAQTWNMVTWDAIKSQGPSM